MPAAAAAAPVRTLLSSRSGKSCKSGKSSKSGKSGKSGKGCGGGGGSSSSSGGSSGISIRGSGSGSGGPHLQWHVSVAVAVLGWQAHRRAGCDHLGRAAPTAQTGEDGAMIQALTGSGNARKGSEECPLLTAQVIV